MSEIIKGKTSIIMRTKNGKENKNRSDINGHSLNRYMRNFFNIKLKYKLILLGSFFLFGFGNKSSQVRPTLNVCGQSVPAGYYAYNGTSGGLSYGWCYLLSNLKNMYCNNIAVSGQCISQGLAASFAFSLTPAKVNSGDKLICNWDANDQYLSTTVRADSALHAFFNYCKNSKGYSGNGDIIFATRYPIDAGGCPPYYTKAEYDNMCNVLKARAIADGIICIDFGNSGMAATSRNLYDCIHLNTQGHRDAADYAAKQF